MRRIWPLCLGGRTKFQLTSICFKHMLVICVFTGRYKHLARGRRIRWIIVIRQQINLWHACQVIWLVKTWQPQGKTIYNAMCAYMHIYRCAYKHHNMTAVRKPVYSSSHNDNIKQRPQAWLVITCSAVFSVQAFDNTFRTELWLSFFSHFPFFFSIIFFGSPLNLKLDSLLINHNYLTNDVHGNTFWCCLETGPKIQGHRS